jgi:hypothetical protein
MYVLSELTRVGIGAAQGCSFCDYYSQYIALTITHDLGS